ncbi:MAG TPA: Stk1 family PASTA domain-containing Ser/Thr kinase [Clostridiales bacterium]|nr:Stk1 family PASTA domain-containing Ser/Thr kinase [Clostridiales bacterium]
MIGKVLGNRYEIVERIGGGGMALVYKAKCRLLNRFVAVKILRPEFTNDEEFVSKFKRESQAAASLSHPNIVNIYDVGNDENDIYYIVMEYIKGKTLKQIIREKGVLDPETAIHIAKQIALALEHAHSNHIVHRDIKPHNILITEDGRVKVTDFGIARAVTSSTVTNTGNVIGSVHYFSPEQARGGYVDKKSDIYSLGIVLYEMITGRVPFDGESPISIALKHIHESVPLPSQFNKDIPKALEDIVLKALQKDQIKRYSSAAEMIEDLNRAAKYPMDDFVVIEDDDDSPTQIIPAIKEEPEPQPTKILKSVPNKPKVSQKSNRRLILAAIAAAFVLALAFTAGLFYFGGLFSGAEKEVPNVVGKSLEEAQSILTNLGFKVEVGQEEYSSEYEKGVVIGQEPSAGTKRKTGYTVVLTISKGPRMVEVPKLVNENIKDIDLLLKGTSLVEGKVEYEYSSLPVGIIIKQDPAPYTKVPEGTKINLVVSQGEEVKLVVMPNLLGKNIQDVKKEMEKLGLKLNITYKEDSTAEKDTVISQDVRAGTEIETNRVVNVVVSKGQENIGQPSEEDELPMNSVSFSLYYDQAEQEEFTLSIVKIQNGISTEIYRQVHNKSKSGRERITIKGRGKAKIAIYFDDKLISTKNIDFETGRIYD